MTGATRVSVWEKMEQRGRNRGPGLIVELKYGDEMCLVTTLS
jgi:hypothetical protein